MCDTILLFCFLNLKGSLFEPKKSFFISLQKFFTFLRLSNFKILEILNFNTPSKCQGKKQERQEFGKPSNICAVYVIL